MSPDLLSASWLLEDCDPSAMETVAGRIAALILDGIGRGADPVILQLEGGLGAGKTTFARMLLRALGHAGPVPSPTFPLAEFYGGVTGAAAWKAVHADWYRLRTEDEVRDLGWDEWILDFDLVLVEWASRFPAREADFTHRLRLEITGDRRRMRMSPSPSGGAGGTPSRDASPV